VSSDTQQHLYKRKGKNMEKFLTGEEADKRTSISRSLRHKLIKEGKHPKPISIGARRIAFIESEIESWIADRIAASRSKRQEVAA
jgi:prophage regulatory protein